MKLSRLLALAIALLCPSLSFAQMAHVQSDCDTGNLFSGSPGTYTYTYPSTPTAGNLVTISVAEEIRTVSSIAGTATTYTINGTTTTDAGGNNNSLWKAIFSGSDTTATITLSGSQSGVPAWVCFAEFSGADSDQSGSTANGAAATGVTSHDSGSVTPGSTNNVIVAAAYRSSEDNWVNDADFTNVTTGSDQYAFGYRIQTSATAQNYVMTADTTGNSTMRIGAFIGTAGGGGGATCRGAMATMGAGGC